MGVSVVSTASNCIKLNNQLHHITTDCTHFLEQLSNYTSLRPVASAAALTLPRRCTFEANWVVMTRPFAEEMRLINAFATSASLDVLPGDRTFVESLIICVYIIHNQLRYVTQHYSCTCPAVALWIAIHYRSIYYVVLVD